MIIANFKFEGEKLTARVPSKWAEMKVRHFLAVETTKNPLELLALLSDVDLKKVLNTRTDISPLINKLVELLNSEQPNYKDTPPRDLVLSGVIHKIPRDFTNITFGQSAMIENYIAAAEGDERKAIAQIMAVVMQPIIDAGPFDLDRAELLELEILELPIIDVFPNVVFFWEKLTQYIVIGLRNYREYQQPTK
jgi:hypothetical protein